jgi:hypothetical protein
MRLPFQEIRNRAIQFAHDWRDAHSERAEAQTFWNEFFNVFGINRRSVASFEATVRNLGGSYDRIDVIWQGVLIGEHKSRGEDLSKAASQAFGYVQSLTAEGRDTEIPRYVIVSDFARMVLYDLEAADPTQQAVQFDVADLHQNIRRFDFLSGIQSRAADPEDPINIKAVEVLGLLHDVLERSGYTGHQLERFLVRILFCLFAEDTGIFEPDAFKLIVENSSQDGSDLGPMLERLFRVLDTPDDSRQTGLPEALAAMPYVNGELFAERLDMAEFNADTRNALLAATRFQWSKISPAVFGSLFQSIMASEAGARRRRQIGAHYTSERDIMKLIRSLFLDDLRADFERAKARRSDLVRFHERLANLKFLDPACGCGNFLVIAYRELRRLEIEVIAALHASARLLDSVDLELFTKIAVDQMHGIEIEEWPARIAEVAMWLIDHQMNLEASQRFGKPLLRLPPAIQIAFVSTNSISQGEQVAPFWGSILAEFAPVITFAHRTFAWQSEARGRAHVHVVIIGLSFAKRTSTMLFEYPDINGDPVGVAVDRINCYLTDAPNVLIDNRRHSLCAAPAMNYGSMMIDKDRSAPDSEGLILATGDRERILSRTPEMTPFIRRLMGGDEFLNGAVRWCLWLDGAPPSTLRSDPEVQRRIQSVRTFRLSSNRPQTRTLGETPALFGEIRQPSTSYLLFPKVGSASRRYFPIGFVGPDVIATGSALIVPGATLYHFGVLSSAMHTAWLYFVGGRMKSDPQYSAGIVFNNFPWPQEVMATKKAAIEVAAQEVLDAREAFTDQTLADLYDPLAMPRQLREAHAKLDRAVDKCYRSTPFSSDRQRVEFLFGLYERLVNPVLPEAAPRRAPRRSRRP